MNIDKVAIANMALANIGQKSIQAFEAASDSARVVKLRYDEARVEALSSVLWNFASGWERGVLLSIDPKPGWSFVYTYPTNALRVFEIWQADDTLPPLPFEVTDRMDEQPGKLIHTNEAEPTFIYTKNKTDPAVFDMDFVQALSWLLAAKIAMPLTKSVKVRQDCEGMWRSLAGVAKVRTRSEGQTDRDKLSTYHRAR